MTFSHIGISNNNSSTWHTFFSFANSLNFVVNKFTDSPPAEYSFLLAQFFDAYNQLDFASQSVIEQFFSKAFFMFLAMHSISFFYQFNAFKAGHFEKLLGSTKSFSVARPHFGFINLQNFISKSSSLPVFKLVFDHFFNFLTLLNFPGLT